MRMFLTIGVILAVWTGSPLFAQEKRSEKNAVAATQQKAEEPDPIEVSAYENRIVVNNAPVGSMLEIYSVVGIKVKEIELRYPSGEYPVDIAKGYYIVRIGEFVRKVAIK